ncbi:hypothetical protein BDV95DRAFT_214172 [Massariosphaeria phaeospora]|uniref:Uncharacterized protein n=1 Tax=Massariosphaeria phaeospora TaxID=100035 RepID=A0A7C8M2Y9_9PLEO|nr:hypothetical protein BDV95DRAFT_214172 [Massariosphaeria phaeospora]
MNTSLAFSSLSRISDTRSSSSTSRTALAVKEDCRGSAPHAAPTMTTACASLAATHDCGLQTSIPVALVSGDGRPLIQRIGPRAEMLGPGSSSAGTSLGSDHMWATYPTKDRRRERKRAANPAVHYVVPKSVSAAVHHGAALPHDQPPACDCDDALALQRRPSPWTALLDIERARPTTSSSSRSYTRAPTLYRRGHREKAAASARDGRSSRGFARPTR